MTSHTISTHLNAGITLSTTGAYGSPLTITSTGGIAAATASAITSAAIATITNNGTLTSTTQYGIDLLLGGSLANTGHLTGKGAGFLSLGEAFVTNSGTINATGTTFVSNGATGGSSGIAMLDGGGVTNAAGGKIIAVEIGVGGSSSSAIGTTVNNSGLIEVTGTATVKAGHVTFAPTAVDLLAGGAVSNSSTGTIIGGGFGIVLVAASAGATVNNSGLITAGNATFLHGLNTYGSEAIVMTDGGSVTNNATGTISGREIGVYFEKNGLNDYATLTNAGVINATGTLINDDGIIHEAFGVILENGGTVTNEATGKITGYFGAYLTGGSALVYTYLDNLGLISGSGKDGVILGTAASLSNAGHISAAAYGVIANYSDTVTNLAGGTITALNLGILAKNALGLSSTIVNDGAVIATGTTYVSQGTTNDAVGAALLEGGSIINEASGTISGYIGAVGELITTIINAGTITGTSGIAAYFTGTNDKLIDDPTAVFHGIVEDTGGTGILELASGTTIGTISSFGSEFFGFPTVSVDAGATWDIGGTIANLLNNGTVNIVSGSSLDISSAVNPASTGIFQLNTQGSLEIAALLGTNVKIAFLGTTPANKLTIDDAADFGLHVGTTLYAGPLLEDFKAGDVIDLKGISSTGLVLSYSTLTGDLQISASGHGIIATLQFQNSSLGTGTFHTATDNSGGTLLTHS